jgi:hypothetical protein
LRRPRLSLYEVVTPDEEEEYKEYAGASVYVPE